jgi:hypothetical protein
LDVHNLYQYDTRCLAQAYLYFIGIAEMTTFMTALTEKVTEMSGGLTPLIKEMTTAFTIFLIKIFDHEILYKIGDNSKFARQNTSDTGIPQWKNKRFDF